MIPYSYNMVDMGGIDLAEANGTEVPGVYERITEAMNLCGDVIMYNWKFAGISIVPSAYTILQQSGSILINGVIQVTELDQITIVGVSPVPPEPPTPAVLVPLVVRVNGTYYPADFNADGFSSVKVEVEPPVTVRAASKIITTSTGGSDAAVSVQEGLYDGFEFIPIDEPVNVVYTEVTSVPRVFDLVSLLYSGSWRINAAVPVIYNATPYETGDLISSWSYNQSVTLIVISQN